MAISQVGVGAFTSAVWVSGPYTLSPAWPSGYSPVAGDVAILIIGGESASAQTTTVSGYTLIGTEYRATIQGTNIEVLYRILDGSESAPSFTVGYLWSAGAAIAIFRNCDTGSLIDAAAVVSNTFSNTTWTPTGVTTSTDGALVFSTVTTNNNNDLGLDIGNEQGFTLRLTPATSYEYAGGFLTAFSLNFASKTVSSAGSVTNPTWIQNANAANSWIAVTFALTPQIFDALGSATGSGSAIRGPLTVRRTIVAGAVAAGTSDVANATRLRTATGAGSSFGICIRTSSINREATGIALGLGSANATWYPFPGITPKTINHSDLDGIEFIGVVAGLTPQTIVGSSPPVGPVLPELYPGTFPSYTPGDPNPIRDPYVPFVYATFDDGTQIINAFDVAWTDPLNGTGAGQLSLPADDAQVVSLVPGCRIRCWIYGVPAFTFIVENAPETVLTSQSEEYGEIVRVSGRGWIAEYDSARVYPYGGLGHPLNPQQRTWSFASPNYPNLTGWGSPVSQGEQRYVSTRNVLKERKVIIGEVLKDPLGQVILDKYGDRVPAPDSSTFTETIPWPAPMDWQVPAAHWIWGQADDRVDGYNYFRGSFTLTERTAVTIAATADNYHTVYLDGIPIIGANEDHFCWKEWKYIEVTLEAGTYLIGAVVVNVPLGSDVQSPPYPDIPGYVWIYDTLTATWVLVKIGGESLVGLPPGVFVGGPDRVVDGGGVVDGIYIPEGTFGPSYGGPLYQRLLTISTAWLDPDYDGTPIGGPASFNPAGFLCAVYERDSLNRLKTIVFRTDGDLLTGFPLPPLDPVRYAWSSLAYPIMQPGWTPAQIVDNLLDEAKLRNNLTDHTLDFGATSDSDGDPWQGVDGGGSYIPGFSVPIGGSMLNALDSLVDQGWIDYRIKAGVPDLEMWNQGGAGGVSGVTFAEGVNVLQLSVRQSPYIYDRLLVKWSGGFVTVGSDGREGYVTVNAQDEDEATRRGNVILTDIQNPDPAVLLEVEPIAGSQPYLDFMVGDYVTVTGIGSLRVMAITVDQDDMGNPSVSVELNKRWPTTERAEYNLLQSLGEGSVGKIKSDPLVVGLPAKIVT